MGGDDEEAAHQRYLVRNEQEQNDAKCQMLEQELDRARVRMTQVGGTVPCLPTAGEHRPDPATASTL